MLPKQPQNYKHAIRIEDRYVYTQNNMYSVPSTTDLVTRHETMKNNSNYHYHIVIKKNL